MKYKTEVVNDMALLLFLVAVCAIPLAIWKLIDIAIWLFSNVSISVGAH
jgi:hypothetical protein